jgi:hypothetical protein
MQEESLTLYVEDAEFIATMQHTRRVQAAASARARSEEITAGKRNNILKLVFYTK